MIVDGLSSLILGFFTFVLNLLPTWSPPSFGGAFSGSCALDAITLHGLGCPASFVGLKVGLLNAWIDVSTFVFVIEAALAVWVAVGLAKGVLWLYDRIPFKSS
jgi:hypothetical protein